MKKFLFVFVFIAGLAYGQGVRFDGVAQGTTGVPIRNPVITVCTAAGAGIPCSPTATTYTDITVTTPCSGGQVVLTGTSTCAATGDTLGNYGFWLKAGTYKYTVSGTGVTGQIYTLTVPVGSDSSGNANIVGNLTATSATVTGNAAIGGPNPWIDVTNPTYGAKCDGSTDDTAAFQSAITAAAAAKSAVMVPMGKQCIIAASGTKALNADSSSDLVIMSNAQTTLIGNTNRPNITFTGTPSSAALSAVNSTRFTLRGITLSYTSASFTSKLLDLTGAGGFTIDHSQLSGAGAGAVNAADLLVTSGGALDGAKVLYSSFGNAVVCVDLGGFSNSQVTGNDFGANTTPCTTVALKGLAQGTSVIGNNFEMLGQAGTAAAIDATGGCFGCFFGGNWFGDMTAGYTGPLIKTSGGGHWSGNQFQGVSTATAFQINGTQQSFVYKGNYTIGTWLNMFQCDGPISEVDVSGNSWNTITNFNTGAGPCFTASGTKGWVIDNNHNPVVTQVRAPSAACTAALPALTYAGANNTGFCASNANNNTMSNAGVYDIDWIPGVARQKSAEILGWTNGVPNGNADDTNLTRNAAGVVQVGTGETANSNGSLKSASLISGGSGATFTGSTGACATTSTVSGGNDTGRLTCTGTTAASTLVIVPGTTAPNGWVCEAFDQTTRANLLQQTANTTTNCTLTATSITQNDVVVFFAKAF